MAEYRLSVLAEQDVEDILDYTWDQHGEERAFRYVERLKRNLSVLAENPLLAPKRTEFNPPVRLFPSGEHTIVYLEKADHIFIVRLLHQRMDIKRHI